MPDVPVGVEHLVRPRRPLRELARHRAEQLDHERKVVGVPRQLLVLRVHARVEQVVAGHQLEQDARHGPDVARLVVLRADDHLRRPVLARLDVVGEVLVQPAGVPEVRDLRDEAARVGVQGHLLRQLRRDVRPWQLLLALAPVRGGPVAVAATPRRLVPGLRPPPAAIQMVRGHPLAPIALQLGHDPLGVPLHLEDLLRR
mmetsp:Transcript_4273/g.10014  ORF Transcript_4273/g.10014 Transcript_4273/m.10014 type:complete len:200 (+) Transcript_4273:3-602(+)